MAVVAKITLTILAVLLVTSIAMLILGQFGESEETSLALLI